MATLPSASCCAIKRARIPVIVLGEFRYGIAQSRHRAAYEAWLASELPNFDVLPVTEQTTIPMPSCALRFGVKAPPFRPTMRRSRLSPCSTGCRC